MAIVSPHVAPIRFDTAPEGAIVIQVRQSVRDLQGQALEHQQHGLKDRTVAHIFRLQDGKITCFDVSEDP